jgi:SRSO17 transposase
MVLLDESADAKAGTQTAGAGRQYNGRLGKVDVCQVGVFLAFVKSARQVCATLNSCYNSRIAEIL